MTGFLRNSADFLFKASGIRVAELSVNAAELSVNAVKIRVLKDYCSFHTTNTFQPNFSEFHRFFLKFSENQQDQAPPNFFLRTDFQTLPPSMYIDTVVAFHTRRRSRPVHTFVTPIFIKIIPLLVESEVCGTRFLHPNPYYF
jgi:hypothetical protein